MMRSIRNSQFVTLAPYDNRLKSDRLIFIKSLRIIWAHLSAVIH
jgi:hypothetical protein